jgi:GGDEF domain-containing protein
MQIFDKVRSGDLDRREWQLTVFACVMIAIQTTGMALLMYPLVFSHQVASPISSEKTMRIAFYGFCGLSLLLAFYLWDRQRVIQRLRREMVSDRKRVVDAQRQASVELLKTMPNFSSFQDRLPMEFRRTASTTHKLSILVVNVQLPRGVSAVGDGTILLGDAAKVISRRLREQDSIYMLAPTCFCAVLPGADTPIAERFSARLNEGLGDAAGAANRFTFKIEIVNYPDQASSATELEQAVLTIMPVDDSMPTMSQAFANQSVG